MFIHSLHGQTVGFDQPNYNVQAGEVFPVTVRISPVPGEGLYSFGVRLGFPPERARVVSVGMKNDVITELRNDGPRLNSPGGWRGTRLRSRQGNRRVLLRTSSASRRSELVTFQVQDLGLPGSYELTFS